MHFMRNHIVLIGFKHAGKSVIGKKLAEKLQAPFVDLDQEIEQLYADKFAKQLTCRQIMQREGENFFRALEIKALSQVVFSSQPSVISLGGGTPLSAENQRILKPYILVHVTAPKGIIFERILMNGQPAFFNPQENLIESFNRLWNEREKVYEKIKHHTIVNDGSIADSANKIIRQLKLDPPHSCGTTI